MADIEKSESRFTSFKNSVKSQVNKVALKSPLLIWFLSELLGTFIFISFGCGAFAQAVLSSQMAGSAFTIELGFGLGLMFGIFAAGPSGGHLNPAVSLAFFVIGKLPPVALMVYIIAQFIGAFLAAAAVYLVYFDAFYFFDGGNRTITGAIATAHVFGTLPQPFLRGGNAFGDLVFGSFLLMIGILSITDKFNMLPPRGMVPMMIGTLLLAIGNSFGFNSGASINPARDLAPRIFTAIAGWKGGVFTVFNNFSWIPVIAPFMGTVLGALVYEFMIGIHNRNNSQAHL